MSPRCGSFEEKGLFYKDAAATRLGEYEINLGIRQHDRCSHIFTKISLPSPVANEVSVREKVEDRARFLCGIEDEGVPRCRHYVARFSDDRHSTKGTETRMGSCFLQKLSFRCASVEA